MEVNQIQVRNKITGALVTNGLYLSRTSIRLYARDIIKNTNLFTGERKPTGDKLFKMACTGTSHAKAIKLLNRNEA